MYYGIGHDIDLGDTILPEPKKRFAKGAIVEVNVPSDKKAGYSPLVNAEGYVVSRKRWTDNHTMPSPGDFVVIVVTRSPNDKKKQLASFNNVFPVRREWLKDTGRRRCSCDLKTVLMRHGCQCGGE